MVDGNVFLNKPIERVNNIARVKNVGREPEQKNGRQPAFQELLDKEENVLKRREAEAADIPEAAPVAYGFINFYNGKAESSYFYLINSTTDAKA